MTFWYIIEGIVGALICGFIFGGWYLIECWLVDLSNRRFDKKMDKNARKEEQPRTCKSCRFYENDCPVIRGKFLPYPNKVCKDYTEKEVEL